MTIHNSYLLTFNPYLVIKIIRKHGSATEAG